MRKALLVMTEDTDPLKKGLQHEHENHKKPWLQMLYLLASGQAQTRQPGAQLLGVHRNTMSTPSQAFPTAAISCSCTTVASIRPSGSCSLRR
jgi:hypothetical protein